MGLKPLGLRLALRGGFSDSLWVGLFSSATAEISGNNYSRVKFSPGGSNKVASGATNATAFNFPTPSAAWPAPVRVGIWQSQSGSGLLWDMDLEGNPAAPAAGASVGFDPNELTISFNMTGSKLTPDGITEIFNSGLIGPTSRYISLHSGNPGTTGANQTGPIVEIPPSSWENLDNGVRNSVLIDFGVQSADLPDIIYVALRENSTGGKIYWASDLANNPDDPEIGDRILIPVNGLVISAMVD